MKNAHAGLNGQQTIDKAFDGLARELPTRIGGTLLWLRSPGARWFRLPLGLLLIAASMFWFLPVIGIELLPVGLLLLSQDIPLLRRPAGLLILWLLAQWLRLKTFLRRRKATRLMRLRKASRPARLSAAPSSPPSRRPS